MTILVRSNQNPPIGNCPFRRCAAPPNKLGNDDHPELLATASGTPSPAAAAILSPVTDLALTGSSFETRAEPDPYFVRPQVTALVRSYLRDTDPKNPLASPFYGNLAGLPPISIHVGDDEVLLDDSRRYFERAVAAGVNITLDVWEGMPHGFVGSVGTLAAAAKALDAVGAFLALRLKAAAPA